MRSIAKKILTDEHAKPVAVQIEYGDWLEIERALAALTPVEGILSTPTQSNGPLVGTILFQGDLLSPIGEPWDAEQ